MLKKILLGVLLLLVGAGIYAWFNGGDQLYAIYDSTSVANVPRDYALQDDSRVTIPPPLPVQDKPYNPLKNVYWGDMHVHTVESLDAVLFGTTLTIEDAYRFSRGAPMRNNGNELMQLSQPLDFVALTDHAEGFGTRLRCGSDGLSLSERFNCYMMEEPNVVTFLALIMMTDSVSAGDWLPDATVAPGVYQNRPRTPAGKSNFPICAGDEDGGQRCTDDARSDWARYVRLANEYNDPGSFTTFAGYEFSPLVEMGKFHRNVIFNNDAPPELAISSLEVPNAIELWRTLEQSCGADCEFLTIPHNMNKGWGLFYSPYTWDGQVYDEAAWELRRRYEPLAEMYQVKGASECALGVGSTDEECDFGQVLKPCEPGQVFGCAFQTSFARQGLKVGLSLQQQLDFNPLAFGFIGSTDTHNASPGDAEEWDFVGKVAAASSPAVRRINERGDREPWQSTLQDHTSGGLAALWAQENTRPSLFAAMQRREAYATSGTRITLRFFAGWGFDESVADNPEAIAAATAGGVPMGGVLNPSGREAGSPAFFVWAGADMMSAPLQRIQMVKGWIDDDGQTHEVVTDIRCSDGLAVDAATGRCPDNGAEVNLSDCSISTGQGAPQLSAVWRDPDYRPGQDAFYYVRVLQNPTCRWSTYDALRLGIEPPPQVPATIRERAWSSPIWVTPRDLEPLDLSLPADVLGGAEDLELEGDKLPDLFAPKPKKDRILSGKILIDEEAPPGLESVRGAEISVDVPVR